MKLNTMFIRTLVAGCLLFSLGCCKKSTPTTTTPPVVPPVIPPVVATNDVDFWLTKGDETVLLTKQNTVLSFGTVANGNTTIEVDTTQKFQTIDGFGYTLTGGSAYVINRLPAADKANLLVELFGNATHSIKISYLRISIGASDLSASVYTYD